MNCSQKWIILSLKSLAVTSAVLHLISFIHGIRQGIVFGHRSSAALVCINSLISICVAALGFYAFHEKHFWLLITWLVFQWVLTAFAGAVILVYIVFVWSDAEEVTLVTGASTFTFVLVVIQFAIDVASLVLGYTLRTSLYYEITSGDAVAKAKRGRHRKKRRKKSLEQDQIVENR